MLNCRVCVRMYVCACVCVCVCVRVCVCVQLIEILVYCFPTDKGPIRTSVIVAPATSPKQQEIIEIVDSQDTTVNSSSLLQQSQTTPSLVSRSPSTTMKQSTQPLRAGDAEQQTNPAAKNSEQVIQLDKQSWEQLPPLYQYMIQMRVIEEQQQLQMAAQQMQGQQQRQQQQPQQQAKPTPPQLPPATTQLQPNFLQNLALQTQMFSMFQAQLANQNMLPQIAGKFPLVATTAATIPIMTTAGVMPSFPANFMVTTATSNSTTTQDATIATSTSNVSMETSTTATSELSTSVANSNSRSSDNTKHQRNDTMNYRINQQPDSPEEPTSDESSKLAGKQTIYLQSLLLLLFIP